MSRALGLRCSRRTTQQAGRALRFCAALWLVFQIACTPIHIYLEPHSDGAGGSASAGPAQSGACVAGDRHAGDDPHGRHPAEQHKFKVTQPTRTIVAELVPVQLMEWVNPQEGRPQPQVGELSGLSPPEFHCSWQFLFRAALPVRAPALLA